MHISQFEIGETVRHSSFKRGQYAEVVGKYADDNSVSVLGSDGVTYEIKPDPSFRRWEPVTYSDGEVIVEADIPGPWEDSEWTYADQDWIGG